MLSLTAAVHMTMLLFDVSVLIDHENIDIAKAWKYQWFFE